MEQEKILENLKKYYAWRARTNYGLQISSKEVSCEIVGDEYHIRYGDKFFNPKIKWGEELAELVQRLKLDGNGEIL